MISPFQGCQGYGETSTQGVALGWIITAFQADRPPIRLSPYLRSKSVYANCGLGSTGHWPVPSGDSPDGMGRASPANEDSLILGAALLVPVGGSPTGTGVSPVLPIFKHALMLPRNPEYSKSRN